MFYGFVITEAGNRLLARMVAGETLTLARVVMDRGTAESAETARKLTAPLEPGPEGTTDRPTVDGATVNLCVEYRSDLGGGLAEGFWIGGFGLYASDPEGGEDIMLGYGSLGDARQYVSAHTPGAAPDVRRYPVSLTVTSGVEVVTAYPAEAWMTAEDVAEYCTGVLLPLLLEEAGDLIAAHNSDEEAHPSLQGALGGLDARLSLLELMYGTDVEGNPFVVTFETLDGLTVEGVHNTALRRMEF